MLSPQLSPNFLLSVHFKLFRTSLNKSAQPLYLSELYLYHPIANPKSWK